MSPLNFDLASFLLIIGVGQGTLLVLILWLRKPTHIALKILALLLFILTAQLSEFLLLNSDYYRLSPHLTRVTDPLIFLIGPAFYYFVKANLRPEFKFKRADWVHLIPFFASILYTVPWFLKSADFKLGVFDQYMTGEVSGIGLEGFLYAFIHIGQTMIYTILAFSALRKTQQEPISKRMNGRLEFLLNFNKAFLLYWVLQFIGLITITILQYYVYQIDFALGLLNAFLISFLSYRILSQSTSLSYIGPAKKYPQSSLGPELKIELLKKIRHAIEKDEVFLDSTFTLQKFAELLSVNKNYITQVINEEFGYGFTDYINNQRIAKAKGLMADPNQDWMKLLAIALESGFNNKTSFNRVFSAKTGENPSDYRRALMASREKVGHN